MKPCTKTSWTPHLQPELVLWQTRLLYSMLHGDWLNGVPSDVLGLHMQDKEFNSCLKYWLGIPLHSAPHLCPACRTFADEYGDHQVGCGGNGDRITRHNAVRDVIFSAAQSAALGPSREAQGLIPESLSRPADVFLPTWQGGRPACLGRPCNITAPANPHS